MRIRPGGNHLDRRRALRPRDYATPGDAFGQPVAVEWSVPPGGDLVSLRVARTQHRLVVSWRGRAAQASGAAVARRYGFSRQTWSRTVLGERWAGETVLVALVETVAQAPPPLRSRVTRIHARSV